MLVYEPSKPSRLTSTGVALPPLLHWLAWKRNWIRIHRSVNRLGVDWVGSPFSQVHWLCPSLLMASRKVAIRGLREIRMVEDRTRTERGKHVACWWGFLLQGVYQFESP
jgi:hypothetical protein